MMFFYGRKSRYQPMADADEWRGICEESASTSGVGLVEIDDEQTAQQDEQSACVPDAPAIAIPSGDSHNQEVEVVVDDDSLQVIRSTSLSELNCILNSMTIWPTRNAKCSSSSLRKRRFLLVVLLLFIVVLLLAVVIAVPVSTTMAVAAVQSYPSSEPTFATDVIDEAVNLNENETAEVSSTTATSSASTSSLDDEETIFHTSSVKDEGMSEEKIHISSSNIPEMNDVNTTSSTVGTTEVNFDTDQNTGEEVLLEGESVQSTISTSPNDLVTANAVDQNTGEEIYEEPIYVLSTASNVALSITSTVAATVHNVIEEDPNTTVPNSSETTVTNEVANNSIDGIISVHMSQTDGTDRKSQWLDAHNTRRRQWHKDNGVSYVPLRWSKDLVSSALTWANVLIQQEHGTFDLYHDPDAQEGENLAMNCGSGSWSAVRPPDNILSRWVEEEVGMSPPDNLHLTQVLWRATTRVGCAEASREYDNGKTCHVQVCRYSKMGNCNMGKYEDWIVPMLLDDSPC